MIKRRRIPARRITGPFSRLSALVACLLLSLPSYGGNFDIDWENGLGVDDGLALPPAHEYSINDISDVGYPMGPLHGHYVTNVPWARSGSHVLQCYVDGSNYPNPDYGIRSELGFMELPYRYRAGSEHYYTMSFYAPSQYWNDVTLYSIIISQWKMFGGGPHAALRLSNLGDYKLTFEGPNWEGDPKEHIGYAVPDAWNDIKVYFQNALKKKDGGITKVWLNGQLVFEHYGVNLLRDGDGYLQFGMYTAVFDFRQLYFDAVRIEDSISVPLEEWATDQATDSPTVSIMSPAEDASFSSGSDVIIDAVADDADGSVTQVEFFEGGNSLGVDTSAPYSQTWVAPLDGAYELTAVATDNENNSTTSYPVNITVGETVETITLTAIQDATIMQNNPDDNGNWSKLEVKGDNGVTSIAKFDISSLSGDIIDAKLRLYSATVPSPVPVSAYRAVGDSWSESTVTYNNGPVRGLKVVGSDTSITAVGQYYELDVTAFLEEKLGASDSLVTVWIENDTGLSPAIEFNSRDLSNPPQLEVVLSASTSNRPPVFVADPVVEANATEDVAYAGSIADDATDPDLDPLYFSSIAGPAWLNVANDGDLTGTPSAVNLGLNSWTVQVSDGNGGTDQATLEITVEQASANQPPAFTSDPINEINATEGAAYSSTIADDASDPESDPMTFSKVSGPSWLSVASDGTLSGTPGAGDVGANVFTVQVDATGGSDTAALNITVDQPSAPTQVFADNFESAQDWTTEWTAHGAWLRLTDVPHDGSYSAQIDGNVTDSALVSRGIDVTGKSSATITFWWYLAKGMAANEYVAFDTDAGSGWVEQASITGEVDPDRVWMSESVVVDVSGTSTLTLRFRGKSNSSKEDCYVDQVEVVVQ